MKIDESSINHNAVKLISDIVLELYDFTDATDNMERIRIASLGEIRGVCTLASVLKEVLKS